MPESRLIDTTASLKKSYITTKDGVVHNHGPEGAHSHAGTAFTTWLDPKLAIEQARSIKSALQKLIPKETAALEKNFADLEKQLKDLDKQLKVITTQNPNILLLASHPVYQYLTKRYNLKLQSVHWEPDEAPTAKQWQALDKMLADHESKWMIWEGAPVKESVVNLATRGIQSIVFSPCGNKPNAGDYLTVMHQNVDELRQVYER